MRKHGIENEEEKWKVVTRRRTNKYGNCLCGKLGKGAEYSDLRSKAVENKVPILITSVHKEASDKDIIKYIYRKTQEDVFLTKISSSVEKRHNAYKLYVPSYKLHIFLDDMMWPKPFRRFVNFRKKFTNRDIDANDKINNNNGQNK